MYNEIDMPFSIHYPPRYRVSRSKQNTLLSRLDQSGKWRVELIYSAKKPPAINISEIYRVLIETYRCLRRHYGETLVFSEPIQATSFIYHSESAFHFPHWDKRFPWRVHFYQVAWKTEGESAELAPERYGGFVLVRPWQVHLKAAAISKKKKLALKHSNVSPAVCEGYLRLRISQELSSVGHQIARNYSAPYSVDAFDSIPFFCPEINASCEYAALAAALTIAGNRRQYSPYELAAVHASIQPIKSIHTRRVALFDGEKATVTKRLSLMPIEVAHIIENLEYSDVRGIIEAIDDVPPIALPRALEANILLDKIPEHDGENFWNHFTNLLNSYIYQGLPILFSVDNSRLYSDMTDDELYRSLTYSKPTEPSACHLVLVHSLIRGTGEPQQDISRTVYVVSDTRNLHSTGGIFLKVTAKRLWAAAARPKAAAIDIDEQPERHYQPLVVCVPKDLQLLWSDLRVLTNCNLALRDRSQLQGFLVSRVFTKDFRGAYAGDKFCKEIRKFSEQVRMQNTSRYVWIVERRQHGKQFGAILDTRCAKTQKALKLVLHGVYRVQQVNQTMRQLDVWEIPSPEANLSHWRLRSNLRSSNRFLQEESPKHFTPSRLLAEAKQLFSPQTGRKVIFATNHDLGSVILQSQCRNRHKRDSA